MVIKDPKILRQPATLHLVGGANIGCIITELTADHTRIQLDNSEHLNTIHTGDLAELHINVTGSKLKVRTSITSKQHTLLQLSYINAQEASVRQLVNWFRDPGNDTPSKIVSNVAVIEDITQQSLQQLDTMIEEFLEQTDLRLLKLAEIASNNEEQSRLFETKNQLRQHREEFRQLFCNHIRQYFKDGEIQQVPSEDPMRNVQFEDLALVDQQAFEDWLSLDVVIRRANDYYVMPLACLIKRLDKLFSKSIDENNLPIGIKIICEALETTLKNYSVSRVLLPTLYHFFEETVLGHLDDLYDTINIRLKNYGVLPNVETQVMRENRQVVRQQQAYAVPEPGTSSETPQNENNDAQGLVSGQAATNTPALFNTARELISLLHQSSGKTASQEETNSADPKLLIDSLTQLQHNQNAVDAVASGASLQEWLQQSSQQPVAAETHDLLQLIHDIFATLNDYPQIPSLFVQQLKRLQIPISKMALIDTSFFLSPEHPARLLLNQLIELCVKSDFPNRALETKFNDIINDINNNFEQDKSVFDKALTELSSLTNQQSHSFIRNAERIAQTYEGRQRVQKAEQAVEKELQRRVSPPEAPAVIIELLDKGWRELLKLTYIKQGATSQDWYQYLGMLDQLLLWISEQATDQILIDQPLYDEQDVDEFADRLLDVLNEAFPGDYRYQDTVENIRHTLKGVHPVEMTDLRREDESTNSSSSDLFKELEAAHPQLVRWFRRAKRFKVGDEFSYLGDDTGQRNIKLAWISENKQHFVFVNSRGQKVFDYDLVDLGSELAKGLSPVAEQSEWPLVERSLYSTVQHAYEKLAYNSSHDELTGLINRKECERQLNSALSNAKNNRLKHCLLYLDIDKFSLANNLYGHVAGDQLLIDLSQLLKANAPEKAMLGRMAGNEFIVLLNEHDAQSGDAFAKTLLHTIEQQAFHWQEHTLNFTASIGLVEINKYTENVVDLIRHATTSCQKAKNSGGNRLVLFHQDAEVHSRRDKLLSWIDQLSGIMNSGKLCLRAQSIVSAQSGDCDNDSSHYEILLAIRNEQGELESPTEFIEAAECYNRMQRVDRWVIENTFHWINELVESGKQAPAVSINLSGNSLNDDQFMDFLLEQFAQYRVPTSNICFEVTETATIDNLAEAADFIREIKRIGCKFSLDDFGSGNASYQYLKHLPVDYLKIDGLFVKEMDKNRNDYALVKSINDIAHLMGMKTIAEFAESEAIIDLLKEVGVDYLQGYAINKPTALDQLDIS